MSNSVNVRCAHNLTLLMCCKSCNNTPQKKVDHAMCMLHMNQASCLKPAKIHLTNLPLQHVHILTTLFGATATSSNRPMAAKPQMQKALCVHTSTLTRAQLVAIRPQADHCWNVCVISCSNVGKAQSSGTATQEASLNFSLHSPPAQTNVACVADAGKQAVTKYLPC